MSQTPRMLPTAIGGGVGIRTRGGTSLYPSRLAIDRFRPLSHASEAALPDERAQLRAIGKFGGLDRIRNSVRGLKFCMLAR